MPSGLDTSGTWVLDTGAGYLALDAGLAFRGGLAGQAPRTGESVGIAARALPRLRMGTLARDQVTPVLTIRAEMVRDITDRPILGLIGQQILNDRALWVDYLRGELAFIPTAGAGRDDEDAAGEARAGAGREDAASGASGAAARAIAARITRSRNALGPALPATARAVPFTLAGDGKVLVIATVRDASPGGRSRPLTLILDTGASKSVLFERTLSSAVQGHARWPSRGGLVAPTLVGPAAARIVRVPGIQLDGPGPDGRNRRAAMVEGTDVVLADSPLQQQLEQVTEKRIHGLLGYSFLRRFRFALDYPNRVLWLDPLEVGQDQRPWEYSHVGMQMERRNGRAEVVAVVHGSAAERAGVRAGDEVLAIDGATVEPGTLIEAARRLEGPPGSVVVVRLRRDEVVHELRLKRARLL